MKYSIHNGQELRFFEKISTHLLALADQIGVGLMRNERQCRDLMQLR
jgi:hypothetical protein